jgi:uncharacterized protein YeaO (DUF488 family)
MIRLKRAYEKPVHEDGLRILVERLWPRGLTKEQAQIDLWLKDIAPSPELRKWYNHDLSRWEEFQHRYRLELLHNPEVARLKQVLGEEKMVTFVFAARDIEHNSAQVLKAYLLEVNGDNDRS